MELMQRDTTEKRLDDLNAKVDAGFERIDADIRALRAESKVEFAAVRAEMKNETVMLRAEMKAGFDSMNERFELMNDRFESTNRSFTERFEAMHRLIIQVGGGLIGTLVVASAGLIATQL